MSLGHGLHPGVDEKDMQKEKLYNSYLCNNTNNNYNHHRHHLCRHCHDHNNYYSY